MVSLPFLLASDVGAWLSRPSRLRDGLDVVRVFQR